MPVIFQYIIKLSISLTVIYLFYQFVLRRLTFYNHNRWYLLAYPLLCVFVPLVNITPVLEKTQTIKHHLVQLIPTIENLSKEVSPDPGIAAALGGFTVWHWLVLLLIAGCTLFFSRLMMQFLSFIKLRKKAILISTDTVRCYQVNEKITPFSFGNSVFINRHLHSETELKQIIRHEFVHIRQKHSLDIIFSELLCMLNWYNPFAWLLRYAIRQNLEFIADNKVLESGADKKQYQYLLLKVIGNNNFSMASNFNFSSLKKRVSMMNKMKTAKVHLLKLLFIAPLMAVLIMSFRNKPINQQKREKFWMAGLTLNANTGMPLAGVTITEQKTGIHTRSDENGFYKLQLPVKYEKNEFVFLFDLPGFVVKNERSGVTLNEKSTDTNTEIKFVYLEEVITPQTVGEHTWNYSIIYTGVPDYTSVMNMFAKHNEFIKQDKKVNEIIGNSKKPIWIIEGIPYAVSKGSKAWFDEDELKDSREFKVWVDGTIMTMEQVNESIDRFTVLGVGACPRAEALKRYGVNNNLLMLHLIRKEKDWTNVDTIPVKQNIILSDSLMIKLNGNIMGSVKMPVKKARMVNSSGESDSDMITFSADTIIWSSETNILKLSGKAFVMEKNSEMLINADMIEVSPATELVIIDGKEADLDKSYTNKKGARFSVIALDKTEGLKKYGEKGKNGVIEISTIQ